MRTPANKYLKVRAIKIRYYIFMSFAQKTETVRI